MPIPANPLVNPEAFDVIEIVSQKNAGLFKLLDGGGRPYKWQINNPAGMQGWVAIYRGWQMEEGTKFKFIFWKKEQIDDHYARIDPLLSYDARKFNPKPVVVYHPVLYASGITKIFVKKKGPLVDESQGKQMWSITVDVGEFRPPPRLNVTTSPDEPQTREPTVKGRLQARIEQLRQEFQAPTAAIKNRP